MTLPTNILQSLISRNRQVLTNLHEAVVDCKEYRNEAYSNGCEDHAEAVHKYVVKYSKDITKLAAVQKALKRELAEQLQTARDVRYMAKLRSTLAARLERAKEEAMARAGEGF